MTILFRDIRPPLVGRGDMELDNRSRDAAVLEADIDDGGGGGDGIIKFDPTVSCSSILLP